MNEFLLYSHILIALASVINSVARLAGREKVAQISNTLMPFSIVLTAVSGLSLVVGGSSIVHACISGSLTLVVIIGLQIAPSGSLRRIMTR